MIYSRFRRPTRLARGRPALLAVALAATAALAAPPARAAGMTETILHEFTGGADGANPVSALTMGAGGVLYGTTNSGGAPCASPSTCGVVFQLTPPSVAGGAWTESVIYAFQGGADGSTPYHSKLLLAPDGSLYGATYFGGQGGYGTVFHLVPPARGGAAWTESVIYSFTGGADGGNPQTDLLDANGVLYGTTSSGALTSCGGGAGCGTVFALSPPTVAGGSWLLTTLHAFAGGASDGAVPASGLVVGLSNALFGTTTQGGGTGCGGTGCGTVFGVKAPSHLGGAWQEAVLHKFVSQQGGQQAFGGLLVGAGGVLYGQTSAGGTAGCGGPVIYGCGTSFQLTPPASGLIPWRFTEIHNYTGRADGAYPNGDLLAGPGGTLIGSTYGGGYACPVCAGTVIQLVPPAAAGGAWTQTTLYAFKGAGVIGDIIDGSGPQASVIAGPGGTYFGTTSYGGSDNLGIAFELSP